MAPRSLRRHPKAMPGADDIGSGGFIRSVVLLRDRVPSLDVFPYCLPAVRAIESLVVDPKVTFLIGDDHVQKRGSQFIVATHSPILMAYPNATINELSAEHGIQTVAYEDTDHFKITRDFLNNRRSFFVELFSDA